MVSIILKFELEQTSFKVTYK